MMRKVLISILILIFLLNLNLFSQSPEEPGKKIIVRLKKGQPPEIIAEEEDKLFELEPEKILFPQAIVYKLSFSPEGKFLACATQNGKLMVFELERAAIVFEKKLSKKPIYSVAFHPNKSIIISGGKGGEINIFDFQTGNLLENRVERQFPISEVKFSPAGNFFSLVSLGSSELGFYETRNYKNVLRINLAEGEIYSLDIASDSKLIAVGTKNNSVIIFSLDNPYPYQKLSEHKSFVLALGFSPREEFLASGAGDARLLLWKVESEKINQKPVFEWVHGGWVTTLKFFDRYLFTGSRDGKVRIFDFSNKKLLGNFKVAEKTIFSLDIDPEGKFLAISSGDRLLSIYRIDKILDKIRNIQPD